MEKEREDMWVRTGTQLQAARAMLKALKGMQIWGVMMGGWESSKWQAVDEAVKQAEAAGITTGEDNE